MVAALTKAFRSSAATKTNSPTGKVKKIAARCTRSTKASSERLGDILAFINSDDVYLPGTFNAVINHFAEHPASKWVCGDTIMFGEGHETRLIRAVVPRSAAHCLSWAYRAPQPGHFWRTELVRSGFQERWSYDFDHDMYVRLLLAGHKCEYIPLPMAAYRLHEVSKTIAEGHRQLEEFDRIAEFYEPQLQGVDQRWCKATRFLRLSYAASEAGRKSRGGQLADARVCNSSGKFAEQAVLGLFAAPRVEQQWFT